MKPAAQSHLLLVPLALGALAVLMWLLYAAATAPVCVDEPYFEGRTAECHHWSRIDWFHADSDDDGYI